jgi:hypothetical protein
MMIKRVSFPLFFLLLPTYSLSLSLSLQEHLQIFNLLVRCSDKVQV